MGRELGVDGGVGVTVAALADWAHFEDVVEHFPDGVTVSVAVRDSAGAALDMRLEYMNAAVRAAQPDGASALGGMCSELWPEMVVNGSFQACMRVLDTGRAEAGELWWTEEAQVARAGYDWKAVRIGSERLLWVLRDNTEAIRRQEEDQAKFRAAFHRAAAGIVFVSPEGKVIDANQSFAHLVGRTVAELVGPSFLQLAHRSDVVALRRTMDAVLGGTVEAEQVEARLLRADGTSCWGHLSVALVRDADGRPAHGIVHVLDVTRAKEAELKLAHAAMRDDLTGLPNRALLVDRLVLALRRCRRDDAACLVLFVDLDHFKVVNDSLGHHAGDQLLRVVAERLQGALRASDTVARIGGDEFVVVYEAPDEATAIASVDEVCGRLAAGLAEPVLLHGRPVVVHASIGVALAVGDDTTPDDLIRDADAALYVAKRRGRNTHAMFDASMRARALDRLDTETALRAALDVEAEVRPYFQPIVEIETTRVVGVEALARWYRGDSVLAPGAFLDVAEDSGLIVKLSEHVTERAVCDVARWRNDGAVAPDFTVSVNVCPQQLQSAGFGPWVEDVLLGAGLPAELLTLELTEGTLLAATESTRNVLADLRALGCRVALDDFGTGYSSLAYLRHLPVDVLKLDRMFVQGASEDARDRALLRTFTALGTALGLTVVAEGVENEAERSAVADAGCLLAQGFHFGRPAPALDWKIDPF